MSTNKDSVQNSSTSFSNEKILKTNQRKICIKDNRVHFYSSKNKEIQIPRKPTELLAST